MLISEPLAWRLRLGLHDELTLTTAAGPRAFAIAGIYREYGNDRGEVLMELATYRRLWHDEAIGGLGLYLAPHADVAQVIAQVRSAAHGRQGLFIRSNAELRALSLSIFERTFLITRVLYWLAAGVAAIGLVSALLAWELVRTRELALLRTLGVTPGGSAALVIVQTLFMGVAAFLAAVPAGLLTALVLTGVINRRAFGWHIDLHLAQRAVPRTRSGSRSPPRWWRRCIRPGAARVRRSPRTCGPNDARAPATRGAPQPALALVAAAACRDAPGAARRGAAG